MHTTPNTEQPLVYKAYRAPLSVKACLLLVLLSHFCQWWAQSFIIGLIPRLIPGDGKSTAMREDLVWPPPVSPRIISNKGPVNLRKLSCGLIRSVAAVLVTCWEKWDWWTRTSDYWIFNLYTFCHMACGKQFTVLCLYLLLCVGVSLLGFHKTVIYFFISSNDVIWAFCA